MEDFKLLKLSRACKEFNVTRQTLYNWKEKGVLNFVKIGGLNFIKEEDIKALINK